MAKIRTGIVVSTSMDKTAVIRVDRMVPHKKYGKRYRVSSKFAAHDETNSAQVGQTVTIRETKPFSKTKTWEIVADETTVTEAKPQRGTKKATKSEGEESA